MEIAILNKLSQSQKDEYHLFLSIVELTFYMDT